MSAPVKPRSAKAVGRKNGIQASEVLPVQAVAIADITVGKRMRMLRKATVDSLVVSIETIGLQQPIIVRVPARNAPS